VYLPKTAIASHTPLGIVGLLPDVLYGVADKRYGFLGPESYRSAARDVNSLAAEKPTDGNT